MVQSIALLVFPLLMAIAAFSDLFTMKIANSLVLAVVVAFCIVAPLSGLPVSQMLWHLAAAAVVLLFSFALFAAGWIGGGDAKLAASIALWLGLELLLPFMLNAAVLGGILTLLVLGFRRLALPPGWHATPWIARLHDAKSGVPYGIALAIAAALIYPASAVFLGLTR